MTINFSDQIRAAKEAKTLNKPFRTSGGPKKFSVYTKNEKGDIVDLDKAKAQGGLFIFGLENV
jgi:hypothetical protein